MEAGTQALADDLSLVQAAREGDETAFSALVSRHHQPALRLASQFVKSPTAAQDAVQDAWVGVIAGLSSFEGRSSFRTWLFSIVINTSKRRAQKDAKAVPLSAFDDAPDSGETPGQHVVSPDRFRVEGKWIGHWSSAPSAWPSPDDTTFQHELRGLIEKAIEGLSTAQRNVITMRDVLGMTPEQTCEALGMSEANQRVLLHRARGHVRAALEQVLGWAP